MANIYEQIELYENTILLNVGAFLQRTTGLPVYMMDKPFIKPTSPYLTLRIVSSGDSGGWSQRYSYADGTYQYAMDNTYEIEIVAYRGRPMTLMSYILAALRGAEELKYQYLYSKGIGFLSATNIAQANTILDGDKTEPRARMMMTFNSQMIIEDLETSEIKAVNIETSSFRDSWNDPKPIEHKLENVPYIRDANGVIVYPFKDHSLLIPTDN